jgi:hypothetical protein
MILSIAGRYEPLMPKAGLIVMSDGIPWSLPILPAKASRIDPAADPTMIAKIASRKLASERNEPAERTSSPTPRLDHRMK